MWLEAHYLEAEKLRGRPLGKFILKMKNLSFFFNYIFIPFINQVQLINTEFAKSFHCRERSGMVSRKLIALKSAREVYCENGTSKILIQIRQKRENSPRQQASLRRKLAIGLRIVVKGTEQLHKRIGELEIFCKITYIRSLKIVILMMNLGSNLGNSKVPQANCAKKR